MLSEIYMKDPTNVSLLLDLLEESDFYVRFNIIQFLGTLVKNSPSLLQDAILASPMGVGRLLDLLDEKREIIRNGRVLIFGPWMS